MQSLPSLPQTGFIRDGAFRSLLGVSHATLWRWTRAGRVPPAHRIGPNTVARRAEDVRAYLADSLAARARAEGGGMTDHKRQRPHEAGVEAVGRQCERGGNGARVQFIAQPSSRPFFDREVIHHG